MNKIIEILLGLLLLLIPIYAWITNYAEIGDAALSLLKGGVVWILILVGAVLLIMGISDLKN
ncbi:MAG: hypothetical protein IH845_04470 [Nanoarchaeota archaeon]|nr:hypothetical protein [Nanoarchaeota archaeon]